MGLSALCCALRRALPFSSALLKFLFTRGLCGRLSPHAPRFTGFELAVWSWKWALCVVSAFPSARIDAFTASLTALCVSCGALGYWMHTTPHSALGLRGATLVFASYCFVLWLHGYMVIVAAGSSTLPGAELRVFPLMLTGLCVFVSVAAALAAYAMVTLNRGPLNAVTVTRKGVTLHQAPVREVSVVQVADTHAKFLTKVTPNLKHLVLSSRAARARKAVGPTLVSRRPGGDD